VLPHFAVLLPLRQNVPGKARAAMQGTERLTERQKHHLELLQAHKRHEDMLIKIVEHLVSEQNRKINLAKRKPFDEMVGISAVTPIVLDYRERKHIFIYSANALTLSLEDMGSLALSANTWTDISFRPGLYIFAPGQGTTTAYVAVKQTDERLVSPNSSAIAATGTKSTVASSSASSVTILAANTSRKGAMIYNDSTQILYLDLSGGTASSSSYSVQMGPNMLFELPGPTIYNGVITGIWASANGNARVTEFS
jgi:hypothetical protein